MERKLVMTDFKQRLISTKRISVWSLGYLGYTTLIYLQAKGFYADINDFIEPDRVHSLVAGNYPVNDFNESWSSKGNIPLLNLSKVSVTRDIKEMFHNPVHFICFPGKPEVGDGNRLEDLSKHFINNKNEITEALVIFLSAETPGDIEKYFIDPVTEAGVNCHYASAFRTDWSIEELLSARKRQVIAGFDKPSLDKAKILFDIFDEAYVTLSSIKEAEIFENTRRSLQYTISTFVNQISLSYPDIDIRKMGRWMLNENIFDDIYLSIGTMGYKSAAAIGNLLEGSRYSALLTLLQDAESANVYSILSYAEMISKYKVKNVTILGISEKGDLKDIRLSPSLILAEWLLNAGINVRIHDPYFSAEEIRKLLPNANYVDILSESSKNECVVIMTPHLAYRFFTQDMFENSGLNSAKLVIDNTGLWKNLTFSGKTIYHIPGDGKFEALNMQNTCYRPIKLGAPLTLS